MFSKYMVITDHKVKSDKWDINRKQTNNQSINDYLHVYNYTIKKLYPRNTNLKGNLKYNLYVQNNILCYQPFQR